jgi:hypothetical protein
MVQLTDTLAFDGSARICADGCLVAEVFAARAGLQDYLGREIDPDDLHGLRDKPIARVYRPASEVFRAESLATFAAAPVTLNHPAAAVTADNWRGLGVGEINGDVVRDGERVRVPLIVRDAAAVTAATTTHKQLSLGYATTLVFPADGRHPDGTACDAWQTDIRINHIALVRTARGGPELRVVDERPSLFAGDAALKTLTIDGLSVANVSDEAEAAINRLLGDNAGLRTRLADAETLVATLTTEKAAIEARVTALEQQQLSPELLREAAQEFAAAVEKATALGVSLSPEMDLNAIMKAAVDARVGDAAKDWTDAQIAISFATLTADARVPDSQVRTLGMPAQIGDAAAATDAAWHKQGHDLNGWRAIN